MDKREIDIFIRAEKEERLFIEDINEYDKYVDSIEHIKEE
jgi:hypothetical protein